MAVSPAGFLTGSRQRLGDATRRVRAVAVGRRRGALPWQLLWGQAARRLSWGVADQGMSSITNFAVSIYIARSLGAVDFGAFSLAYVTYAFVLNASRGLATEPLMVRFTGADIKTWRRATADCTGTSIVVGLAAGACVLALAMLMSGTTRLAFLALGLTLPGLMLQDSFRYAFFTLGRGSQAFLNDLTWAVLLLPALVLVKATGHANVFLFVLVWGASATVAAAVGPLQARVIPRPSGVQRWLSSHRDLGPRFLGEFTASGAAPQLRTYGIGAILGLAAVGYVQAANTLMGPIMVLFLGMGLVTTPEAARVLRRDPRRLPLFCFLVSAGLTVAGLAWGLVLLVALPRGLGHWLLGSLWRGTYPLVLPQTIAVLGMCAGTGSGAGLHALGAARRSFRVMVLTSVIYIGCALTGAVVAGAAGTIWGTAAATWFSALLWWRQLGAAMREAGHSGADDLGPAERQPGRHIRPVVARGRRAEIGVPPGGRDGAAVHPGQPEY
jgi:O-antigen/teichoic acid export membrane protein